MTTVTAKRNDPCPCGSGKKYKKCCFAQPPKCRFKATVLTASPIGDKVNSFHSKQKALDTNTESQ